MQRNRKKRSCRSPSRDLKMVLNQIVMRCLNPRILTNFTLVTEQQNRYTRFRKSDILSLREGHRVIRAFKRHCLAYALVLPIGALATHAVADPAATPASTAPATHIELNKLEGSDKGCRAYMVVNNPGETAYQSFKIDLVLFQTDGVIGRRFSIDLAPLRPKKKSVKLFEIDGIQCDKIGSLLINDVMDCKADAGPVSGCLESLKTSTLTNVQLSK
jgi:hypothetical protein